LDSKKKFREMDRSERLNYLRKEADLSERDIDTITDPNAAFSFDNANQMIENAIGIFSLPQQNL
jgi:hydroxymethylglutaryl-CoA reductase